MRKTALACALVLLGASPALAQSTFHDSVGNVVGKSRTDLNGVTTLSNRAGFTTGKARTDSNGVTRFYDASGRQIGSKR